MSELLFVGDVTEGGHRLFLEVYSCGCYTERGYTGSGALMSGRGYHDCDLHS